MSAQNVLELGRTAWRSLAPHGLRRAAAPLANKLLHHARMPWILEAAARQPQPGPLIVSGFFDEAMGIGRAGQLTADALEKAGFQIVRHAIRPVITQAAFRISELPGEGGVWISHCNAPEAAMMLSRLRNRTWLSRYRIGYWAWELPRTPASWLKIAPYFHEIWTPSQYVADSLAETRVKVRVMPHPVHTDVRHMSPNDRFKLAKGHVQVLALADLKSSLARKNPIAAIEAFKLAFPIARPACRLVVKLNNIDADPAALAQVRAATVERPDIELMTEVLSGPEMEALIGSSDIIVSLHRAEGYGLVLAEAMAQGKTVVATGWSGNLEFMASLPELLAPFTMVSLDDPSGVYRDRRQMWAEPDVSAASIILKRQVDDAAFRARLSTACREAIVATHAPWNTARLLDQPFARYVIDSSRPTRTLDRT